MKNTLITFIAVIGLGASMAYAHPHDDEKPTASEEADKKIWPYFGEKSKKDPHLEEKGSAAKSIIEKHFKQHAERIQRDMDKAAKDNKKALSQFEGSDILENPENLRDAARALEDMLAESNILENMAAMFVDMAENIEIDQDDDGLTLRFDGEKLGSVHMKREGRKKDNIILEGLGQNLDIEKEVVIENGKKRTRIVIEMDGGEDVEIDVNPKRDHN